MAARYWVPGGTGNWNATSNWSTTSGGSSGASFPSASDDAIFDANSGSGIATINVTSGCLSLNCTGFTGTLAGANTLTVSGGNVTFGSGMTITWTGILQFNVAGSTITSNGKSISGIINIASGFASGGTITLADPFSCGSFVHNTITGNVIINGFTLTLKGHATSFQATSARHIQGTTKFIIANTSNFSLFITGSISNDVDIISTSTLTQTSTITIAGGTWKYYSGTLIHGGNGFSFIGNCTMDLGTMVIGRVLTGAACTVTCNSLLNVAVDIQYSLATGFIWAGTHGFSCATLTDNQSSTGRAITLAAGVEYFVTGALTRQSGYLTSRATIMSSTPGTKAKLTLGHSVTQFIPYCNMTDIDASNGKTIWVYDGTISNCDNVRLLNHSQPTIASTF